MVLSNEELNIHNPANVTKTSEVDKKTKEKWSEAHSVKMADWGDISSAHDQQIKLPLDNRLETIGQQLEYIINWAVKTYGTETFAKAKNEFYLLAGKFFYDDPHFHQRIHYFLDHFIFEKKISDHLKKINSEPPYFEFISSDHFNNENYINSKNQAAMLDLRKFRHSIYLVKKVTLSELTIIDLLTDEKIKVSPIDDQIFHGIKRKQVFQSYIFNWKDKYHLSKGIILHPEKSWKVILKKTKIVRKSKEKELLTLLMKLAKLEIEAKVRKPQTIKQHYLNSLF